jgi:hypothetical protein
MTLATPTSLASGSQGQSGSIYGNSLEITADFYKRFRDFAKGFSSEDGLVKLDNGQEVDVKTLAGMTAWSTETQFLQAFKEILDQLLNVIKNLENKLHNLLGS